MFDKYLLLSSMISMGGGAYYFWNAKIMKKRFSQYEKYPIYDFNYINNIDDIPEKDVFLGGYVTHLNSVPYPEDQNIQVLYQHDVQIDKDQDLLWKSHQNIQIQIQNPSNQNMIIENNKNGQIMMYNLNDLKSKHNSDKLQKKAIIPGNYYVFQGKIQKNDLQYTFKTNLILSESKEIFLKHLDDMICKNFDKSLKFTRFAFFILIIHAFYKNIFREKSIQNFNNDNKK